MKGHIMKVTTILDNRGGSLILQNKRLQKNAPIHFLL